MSKLIKIFDKNSFTKNEILKTRLSTFKKKLSKKKDDKYYKVLEFVGIGFRIMIIENGIRFDLGKSHIIEFIYDKRKFHLNVLKNTIIISGNNKAEVGSLSFFIKNIKD
tara:strand:+ start:863 stop:1189 length:327 start_codon:yes stop_codon:yes gene_type:complete